MKKRKPLVRFYTNRNFIGKFFKEQVKVMSFLKRSNLARFAFSNQALSLNVNAIEKIFYALESYSSNN